MTHPLTLGLLASMALRLDHGFGIQITPYETHKEFLTRQHKDLEIVKNYYNAFVNGALIHDENNEQLNEEICSLDIGSKYYRKGFYYPCHEKEYASYVRCDVRGLL